MLVTTENVDFITSLAAGTISVLLEEVQAMREIAHHTPKKFAKLATAYYAKRIDRVRELTDHGAVGLGTFGYAEKHCSQSIKEINAAIPGIPLALHQRIAAVTESWILGPRVYALFQERFGVELPPFRVTTTERVQRMTDGPNGSRQLVTETVEKPWTGWH